MRRHRFLIPLLLAFLALSCQKAPLLELNSSPNLTFSSEGGGNSIRFTTNREWTVTSSASWCRVTPSGGTGTDAPVTVSLNCEPNSTYDDRSCTVTVRADELSQTVTVSQSAKTGLIVAKSSYELGSDAQVLELEVQANIPFSVEVDAAARSWISHTDTKGLDTRKVVLQVAANEDYDAREGKITIRQQNGALSQTVTISQAAKEGLLVQKNSYELGNGSQSLELVVQSNIRFSVEVDAAARSWISHVETKGLVTNTIVLQIAANESYDEREGKITIRQQDGPLSQTITVSQAAKEGLLVSDDSYELSSDAQVLDLEVKANVQFEVAIDAAAQSWISRIQTKGLTATQLSFQIAANEDYDSRRGTITIRQKDGSLSQTVTVIQAQKDAIIPDENAFWADYRAQELSLSFKANVEGEVRIPETVDWLHVVPPTKGLEQKNIVLSMDENRTGAVREARFFLEKGSISREIVLQQAPFNAILESVVPGVYQWNGEDYLLRPGIDQWASGKRGGVQFYRLLDPEHVRVLSVSGIPEKPALCQQFELAVSLVSLDEKARNENYTVTVIGVTDEYLWLLTGEQVGILLKK